MDDKIFVRLGFCFINVFLAKFVRFICEHKHLPAN
jgi:hypothetical protein